MSRQLFPVKTRAYQGWGCTQCSWRFNDPKIAGNTMEELIKNFEAKLDKAFEQHDCRLFKSAQT